MHKRWGLVEWCELGKMEKMMKLGDGKWTKNLTGERTLRTIKAGGQLTDEWEQGEEEDRRYKEGNRGTGDDDLWGDRKK